MQNINEILEEGEKIYPIDKDCDDRIDRIYKMDNWAETFYNIKKGKMRQRFIELTKNCEYSHFFQGLNYEYGINNFPKDINKAFHIYKKAADNYIDPMSMFRMYQIYKKDFKKFNIEKRIRILEKFYLFKSLCYARYPIMKRNHSMCNRFDVKLDVLIHFDEEDKERDKFPKFIEHLKQNYKLYFINLDDVNFIEVVINIMIKQFDDKDINKELINLSCLINENNLETLYKYVCLNNLLQDEYKEAEFKKLYEYKYYRSYIDYALFLNSKGREVEALKILKEAKNNGVLYAGFLYFDIYLNHYGFEGLIKDKNNFSPQCELYNIFQILFDDIIIESVFSFYEYIFLLKLCFKHLELEYIINVYFYDYTKEVIEFLINITKETNAEVGKKLVMKYFCDEDNYKEYHLACGVAHFYGIKNILQRNIDKAYYHINLSYNCESSPSYKRFCYFYLYKISQIYYKEKTLLLQGSNNNAKMKINKSIEISETKLKSIKAKIFLDYFKSLNDKVEGLSSSYFYYLSRLYHKKVGNQGNELMEYICLKRATEYNNNNPGSGSIISFYRKYKAKKIFEEIKNKCEYIFSHSLKKKDSEGYGENGDICPICFDKKRNVMSLPCKHLFCDDCIKKMEKCPICRSSILVRHKLNK